MSPHGQFSYGPNANWFWEKGERFAITYPNGQTKYWTCPETDPALRRKSNNVGHRQAQSASRNNSGNNLRRKQSMQRNNRQQYNYSQGISGGSRISTPPVEQKYKSCNICYGTGYIPYSAGTTVQLKNSKYCNLAMYGPHECHSIQCRICHQTHCDKLSHGECELYKGTGKVKDYSH